MGHKSLKQFSIEKFHLPAAYKKFKKNIKSDNFY